MTVDEIRGLLASPESIRADAFGVLKRITSVLNAAEGAEDASKAQELILLALDRKAEFARCEPVLYGLVREVGLFPYLEPDELGLADRIAYEFHRPLNTGDWDVVFHRPQARVYRELISGRSVVLSAPTSFGKSLVIDAVVASGQYKNILVIVPTIALIDETRRRLARFRDAFKVITHPAQGRSARNIFILTQERVLELHDLDRIDFFVLDEFYKLSPTRGEDDRCALLNQALYRLLKKSKPFYMLGPTIRAIEVDARVRLDCLVLQEPYNTVVTRVHRVHLNGLEKLDRLVQLCCEIEGPTIVFCSSPNRATRVARRMVESGLGVPGEGVVEAANWVADHYHPGWHLVQALRSGVGVHHGRIPRALAQYVVRCFNGGKLCFLVCTSSLIEGVNTKAKNVVVLDDKIDRSRYDLFTFNNIKGRSGRMFQHFVGDVYLFHDPPQEGLPLIDIPALTQPDDAPDSLLLQLDEEDLREHSRDRLRRYEDQDDLAIGVMRANVGIDPELQLELARHIAANLKRYYGRMNWAGNPTWEQVSLACQLIWERLNGSRHGAGSVRSHKQLATLINRLRNRPSTRELILDRLAYREGVDEAVSGVLDFLRLWANIGFPRLLRAVDRIQRYVFARAGLTPGDYEAYASQVESLFREPTLIALDEYGIPFQLALKLAPKLQPLDDLDQVLVRLRGLSLDDLGLLPFEREVLEDANQYL